MSVREFIKKNMKNPFLGGVINFLGRNRICARGRGNKILFRGNILWKCKIDIEGKGNVIIISSDGHSIIRSAEFKIRGDNNKIVIKEQCRINSLSVCIEDNGNIVSIGCKNNFAGNVHIAAIEGTEVIIGDDCLFSSDVTFRTGDSHSIISNTLGDNYRRLNPSENIKIGNHVWFGNSTKILKGVSIRGNTIIGTGSIVTKSIEQEYVIVAGNPAKIVKSGVNWLSKRI